MTFRLFRTNPGVAAAAIIALSLGIGFTATMFAIVHGSTRPLPVPHPEQIVAIQKVAVRRDAPDASTRHQDVAIWREARSFASLGAFEPTTFNIAGDGQAPERIESANVTTNAFTLLGVAPALGRGFTAEDGRPDAAPVVLLSNALWKTRFGAGDVLGTQIRLNGRPHTVIGVLGPGVGFPVNARLWTPSDGAGLAGPVVTAFGRLADGATIDAARAELDLLTEAAPASGNTRGAIRAQVFPFTEIETPREVIQGLHLLVLAVSMVLLIACANVASLLVVRGAARAKEIATRIAIGASRRALIAEQLAESLTLAAIAGLAGLGIAQLAIRAFSVATADVLQAYWVSFRIDGTVVAFATLLAAVAAAAAGLGPALRISSTNAIDVLKDRGHGSTGARLGGIARRLPAAQMAMACGLLALTVVFSRAAVEMRSRPWPFDPSTVVSAQYAVTPDVMADQGRRNRLITNLIEHLEQQPEIETVGLTSTLPGTGSNWSFTLDQPPADDRSSTRTTAVAMITPRFLDVVNARVLAGRPITEADDAAAPAVALANQSFVDRHAPGENIVGRQVFIGTKAHTVVGVVSDAMAGDVAERQQDGLYLPMLQARPYAIRVMAKARTGSENVAGVLAREAARVDPDLPLFEIATVRDAVFRDKAVLDIFSTLFLCFGAGALGLTGIGLYSVVAFTLAQRTREFGVRMALGATSFDIARLVARQGGWQIVVGVTTGVAIAVALTRAFAAAMDSAPRADGEVFGVIAIAVACTSCVAMLVPARRAMSLGIVQALKRD